MKWSLATLICILMCFPFVEIIEAQKAEKKPIRVAYLQNDIHHLPLWISIDKGMFKGLGVNIEVEGVFRSGPEIMSAFSAKAIDLAYVGEAPVVTAVANGTADIAILAQINTKGSAIVVGKDSAISTLSDLKGRQIAVPGYSTVQDFLIRKCFSNFEAPDDKPNIMVLKPPEMISALRTNQIESFIAWEPYPAQAVKTGTGTILAASGDIWPNHPCCVLVSDRSFAEKNDPAIRQILQAHEKAITFINENPVEAIQIAAKYTGLDEEIIKDAMTRVTYVSKINEEGLEEYVTFLNGCGYIKLNNIKDFVKKILY